MRSLSVLCPRSRRSFSAGLRGLVGVLGLVQLTAPQVQAANHYVSDLTPVSAINGWGPFERDRSNGELGPNDGNVITIGGKTYQKGLGVHADSRLTYKLNRNCHTLTSDVGVDDEVGDSGSVIFQVWGDGQRLYLSNVLRGSAEPQSISVNVAGVDQLELVVTAARDGIDSDYANWAGAQLNCTATPSGAGTEPPPVPTTPPPSTPAPAPSTPTPPPPSTPTAPPISTPPATLREIAPVFIRNQRTVAISGVRISNPRGTCIDIEDAESVTIENSTIGPCAEAGIDLGKSRNITIRNVHIHDTTDNGMTLWSLDGANITDNRIENTQTAIRVERSTRINVSFNTFQNVVGPFPRGQFVQFDRVSGAGVRIACNVGENIPNQSYAEDAISLYQSDGTSSDPIQVIGNKIKGGGPSRSGGGIMLGDGGGSNQTARDNILVNPGQYGIAISSGTNMSIVGNTVYGRQQSFTNVGLSVWNQYPGACSAIQVENNVVNWRNSSGEPNPSWDGGNCGRVAGWSNNTLNAPLNESIFDRPIAACQR